MTLPSDLQKWCDEFIKDCGITIGTPNADIMAHAWNACFAKLCESGPEHDFDAEFWEWQKGSLDVTSLSAYRAAREQSRAREAVLLARISDLETTVNINASAAKNASDKLVRANERIVEFEDIKAGHLEIQKKLHERIKEFEADNEDLKLRLTNTVQSSDEFIRQRDEYHAEIYRQKARVMILEAALSGLALFTEQLCEDTGVSKHYPSIERARKVLDYPEGGVKSNYPTDGVELDFPTKQNLCDEIDRLADRLDKLEAALQSSNLTLRYVQDKYARGHGLQLIHATIENNLLALEEGK